MGKNDFLSPKAVRGSCLGLCVLRSVHVACVLKLSTASPNDCLASGPGAQLAIDKGGTDDCSISLTMFRLSCCASACCCEVHLKQAAHVGADFEQNQVKRAAEAQMVLPDVRKAMP